MTATWSFVRSPNSLTTGNHLPYVVEAVGIEPYCQRYANPPRTLGFPAYREQKGETRLLIPVPRSTLESPLLALRSGHYLVTDSRVAWGPPRARRCCSHQGALGFARRYSSRVLTRAGAHGFPLTERADGAQFGRYESPGRRRRVGACSPCYRLLSGFDHWVREWRC